MYMDTKIYDHSDEKWGQKIWVFMFSCPETRLDRVGRDHFTNCAVYCACLTLPQPIS